MRLIPLFLAAVFVGCDGSDKDTGDTDTDLPVTSDADGDGYTSETGDCNDDNAAVYPGADEVWYDGTDQDCLGDNDYDQDADGYDQDEDCEDENADISPGATDACDSIDNDCDGEIDEGGELAAYLDADADGFGTGAALGTYCELPVGTASNDEDCDDTNAALSPVAAELCDGLDNDCNGEIDIGAADARTVYADADADGFGDIGTAMSVCEPVEGTVEEATDCDDTDASTFPGATELCDLEDNDCDSEIDEGSPEGRTYYMDADVDGYGDATVSVEACGAPGGYVEDATDCNDTDAALSPGATERCDGVDNDCDAEIDTDSPDALTLYADSDADGYGNPAAILLSCDVVSGYVSDGTDCDDTRATTSPAANEVCDAADNNCDGATDESTATDAASWYIDADVDGYGDASGVATSCEQPTGFVAEDTDCNDTDASVYPNAVESCDGFDEDCDGAVDNDAADASSFYADSDGDTYGDAAVDVAACDAPAGYVADDTDCDDGRAFVYPGAAETCDGTDEDCDGAVDDSPTDGITVYADGDSDGYGDSGATEIACGAGGGYILDSADCDDGDSAVNPSAVEACDDLDNDCDDLVDEAGATGGSTWYRDADADGYGLSATTTEACDRPVGYAGVVEDCDDGDSTSYPGASELDDGADNDCDGSTDEGFVAEGDVIITEIARQTLVGGSSTNSNAAWFELYNTTSTDIDLSGWYIRRYSSTLAADAYYVDPADDVVILAGDYAVFCKTDNFVSSTTSYSFMDPCDYYWGDETASSSYSGTYADNTFNLQRDTDSLAIYADGSDTTGTLIDRVAWTYSSTDGYWPRDATRSMQLDPSEFDSTANDSLEAWCSTTNNAFFDWYYASASAREFGTPGIDGHRCP
ncbi:MAG: MopE-related protein [Pseudomonadota bacterium]|nr:MopE-related protein [Pseudomonadota bacterium]